MILCVELRGLDSDYYLVVFFERIITIIIFVVLWTVLGVVAILSEVSLSCSALGANEMGAWEDVRYLWVAGFVPAPFLLSPSPVLPLALQQDGMTPPLWLYSRIVPVPERSCAGAFLYRNVPASDGYI